MGLRPGHCYRDYDSRAFTRIAITKHKKNYVGAAPSLRIKQFNMGNSAKEYSHIVDLKGEAMIQIRDNAIESARVTVNRYLTKHIGKENYFMRIRVYPFHCLRENKQAQGAGADRVSQGMAHSFGKVIGRAARIKKGQILISVLVDEEHVEIAKQALERAKIKLPCKISLKAHTDVNSIGTRPRSIKMREGEKKEEAEEIATEEGKEEKNKDEKKDGTEADGKTEEKKDEGKEETKEGKK